MQSNVPHLIFCLPLFLATDSGAAVVVQESQSPAHDKALLGEWEGAFKVNGVAEQDILWRFEVTAEGVLKGFMGPAEAGAVLPMEDLLASETSLSFNLNSQGRYSGSIANGKIKGTWTDKEQVSSLDMSKRELRELAPRDFVGSDRTWLGTRKSLTASVSTGDLDGDGDVDIVIGNGRHWPQRNEVFFNNGEGRFSRSLFLGSERNTTYKVLCTDVDGDGDIDILVGNEALENNVHINDGKGNFQLGSKFGAPRFGVRDLLAVDFDGDELVDIFEFTRGGPNAWFLNDGRGRFNREDRVGANRDSIGAAAAADLNGDLLIDFVLVDRDRGKDTILYGGGGVIDSTRSFGRSMGETHDVAIADMDADGWPDIVTASIGQPNQVYFGDEAQGFKHSADFGSDARAYALAVGDLDKDGDIDIVIGNQQSRNVAFFNNGDGRSFQRLVFGPKSFTYDIALADLNGDGYLDVVAANTDGHNQIFINVPPR